MSPKRQPLPAIFCHLLSRASSTDTLRSAPRPFCESVQRACSDSFRLRFRGCDLKTKAVAVGLHAGLIEPNNLSGENF